MKLTIKKFNDLSPKELYNFLALRQQVFVVEQNAAYQDNDGNDEHCHHLWLTDNEGLLSAYGRIVPAGLKYSELSIGRIVSSPKYRGQGFGRAIVIALLKAVNEIYGSGPIRISAQQYLEKFYEGFGFRSTSKPPYLEDNIPHIEMLKK